VTPGDRTAARAALEQGRPTYARLDQIRGPEDTAADLVDLWHAAEQAMRAMLGGSVLAGQTLVRELRQRGTLSLEQANAIASFWDARSRVDDVGYKPTLTDVGYARAGYNELERAITSAPADGGEGAVAAASGAATSSQWAQPGTSQGPGAAARPTTPPDSPQRTILPPPDPVRAPALRRPGPGRRNVLVAIVAVVAVAIAIGAFLALRSSSYDRQMSTGIQQMQAGQTAAAQATFAAVARANPDRSTPHVFLARLARNAHDDATARQELVTAIRLDTADALALREMGMLLLSENNPDLARSFLVRAIRANPADSASQGYLGCALMQLNRPTEAQTFLSRAGPGSWSVCASPAGAASVSGGAAGPAGSPPPPR